ncbi:MAG TPA: DUF488 family protein [Gemmatimonadaceae bacterium]|nr:DUF488 family protein [Gemmatimonadaceae bacterium]
MVVTKRVYDAPAPDDGWRVLVERLWPRGLKKEAAHLDAWEKRVAPSDALRKWYAHDPAKWEEFQRRYARELEAPEAREALDELVRRARRGRVTLLYASRAGEISNAAALQRLLAARLARHH